jgi:2-(1,2-epoxy-1,2-dihydrophenyl)acetyl-CoA isomerase
MSEILTELTHENQILKITINRPEVYNALNLKSKKLLVETFNAAKSPVIILSAQGKAFCSGQDLSDRNLSGSSDNVRPDLGHTLKTEWIPLIKSMRNSPSIIIGAINGISAGAGLSLMLSCDLIVSLANVKLISGFAQIGLAPDAGSSFHLVRRFGYQKALSFALGLNPMTTSDWFEAGIIHALSENPTEKALEIAQELIKLPHQALEKIKKNFQFADQFDFNMNLEQETLTQQFLGRTPDYQEGVKAFMEKRKPQFNKI